MSLAAIRSQVKTVIESAPQVGIVHDYDRYANTWDDFLRLFQTTINHTDHIRGWTIHSQSDGASYPGTNQVAQHDHVLILRAYMSLSDPAATEKTFDDMVEAVQRAFLGNYTLNGTAMNAEPPQVVAKDVRFLSDVLVHYAELHLQVRERVTY